MNIGSEWVDPDDAPEFGPDWFERAEAKPVSAAMKRGGRPRGSNKELVSLRIDQDVLAAFRATGAGWQSRINDTLRRALPDVGESASAGA